MRLVDSTPTLLVIWGCSLGAVACGSRSVSIADLEPLDLQLEILLSSSVDAAGVAREHRVLAEDDGDIVLLQAGSPLATSLDSTGLGLVDAASLPTGELVVATDGDLRVWVDDSLETSDLTEAVGQPVSRLQSTDAALWLHTGSSLHRLQGSGLRGVSLGEAVPTGPFAVGPGASPVAWVATEDGLLGLRVESGEVVDEQPGLSVDGVGVDARGEVFVASEGKLWQRDPETERWTRTRMDADVTDVAASPEARGAWLSAGGVLLHAQGEALRAADRGASGELHVDELGRLVVADPSGLLRMGASRSVAVLGLRDGDAVAGTQELTLEPSRLGELASLEATVDGAPLEVDLLSGTVELDPSGLSVGESHSFQAVATWADGGQASSQALSFTVDRDGDFTWEGDIEPLFQESCAICHGGDSETQLDTPEAWEDKLDTILDVVSSGAMPIGGDPLTDDQIAMIQAWADGGFD